LDLVPEKQRGGVVSRLTNDIVYRRDTHVTTGFIGVKYLLPVLTRFGHSDLAYDLAVQDTYPSWGYMVRRGATTLWELWQEKTGPAMNSHNHAMFGSVGAWFYQALAGINLGENGAGYRHLRIAPQVVEDLRGVSGSVETVRGRVSSTWAHSNGEFTLDVTIPVSSDAKIVIPKDIDMTDVTIREADRVVWEKGHYVPGAPGISGATAGREEFTFDVGSGRYSFKLTGS
jgi:alpha-L-rhamnosidase